MNRLKILLLTTALITGSSALASAQETYHAGFAVQVRLGGHTGDRDDYRNGYYGYGDGDHDRDDHYFKREHRKDRDDRRWRDRDDYRWSRNYDRDHDGDRR